MRYHLGHLEHPFSNRESLTPDNCLVNVTAIHGTGCAAFCFHVTVSTTNLGIPMSTTPAAANPVPPPMSTKSDIPAKIYLVSYPKIVFLYPTFLMSLIAAITLSFVDAPLDPKNTIAVVLSSLFLGILTMNLIVFSFDFPRTTSLTLFFFCAAVVMALVLTFQFHPEWAGVLQSVFTAFHPLANSTFYYLFAALMGSIYLTVLFNLQYDYWEAQPNELLHHHGLWSDLERVPSQNMKIRKEINDIFEYLLLRSGRLILTPSGERRDIVLENVLFIDRKERALTKMLSALQVQMTTENNSI